MVSLFSLSSQYSLSVWLQSTGDHSFTGKCQILSSGPKLLILVSELFVKWCGESGSPPRCYISLSIASRLSIVFLLLHVPGRCLEAHIQTLLFQGRSFCHDPPDTFLIFFLLSSAFSGQVLLHFLGRFRVLSLLLCVFNAVSKDLLDCWIFRRCFSSLYQVVIQFRQITFTLNTRYVVRNVTLSVVWGIVL